MAEWTNLFDLGECTVEVVFDGDATLYSEVMAKGDSAEFSAGGRDYTIAVSADGAVTLEGGDDDFNRAYEVNVIPSYPHDYPARIRDVSVGEHTAIAGAQLERYAFYNGDDPESYLDFDSLTPPTPDPLDMSALTGSRNLVGGGFENVGV